MPEVLDTAEGFRPGMVIKGEGTVILDRDRARLVNNSFILRKWFEPRSNVPWLKMIVWVTGVLRRSVVDD